MFLSDDHSNCRVETEMTIYCMASAGNLTPLILMIFKKNCTPKGLIFKLFLFLE